MGQGSEQEMPQNSVMFQFREGRLLPEGTNRLRKLLMVLLELAQV